MANTNTTPPIKPYLALSFDTVEVGNDGQKHLKLSKDRFTDKLGHDNHNFLGIPRKCFLTIRVLQDMPKRSTDSNGNVTYSYDHEMWHMEHDGTPIEELAENNYITVKVVCTLLGNGIGDTKPFTFSGSADNIVQLGEIDLTGGDYEFQLVGDVHLCFWNKPRFPDIYPSWRFKKPAKNLKYYIRVN